MDFTTSRAGRSLTALAMSLLTLMAITTVATAANPTGKYKDARTTGKITYGIGASERFDLDDGAVKLSRTQIVLKFTNPFALEKLRVKLRLRERVANDHYQTVVVDRGEVAVKNLITGEPRAWGGTCNHAKYKVWQAGDVWKIRHKKKLAISGISGVGIYQDSKVRRTTLEAQRD